jgi:uncharacterized protein YeaO (DUF488 family)
MASLVAERRFQGGNKVIPAANVRLKRAYEPVCIGDGARILVDRLWPRGLSKADARLDQWVKEIAPSAGLRRWFGHRPDRWAEFQRRYRRELAEHPRAIGELRHRARHGPITLIYAARDTIHNDAAVLRTVILGKADQQRS